MKDKIYLCGFTFMLVLVLAGCTSQSSTPTIQAQGENNASKPRATFILKTAMMDGKMVYVGSGGSIDGIVNPDLATSEGDTIQIVLVNGDGMPHDLAVPALGVQMAMVSGKGQSVTATVTTSTSGEYTYYCTVSGHRQAGMEGRMIVSAP